MSAVNPPRKRETGNADEAHLRVLLDTKEVGGAEWSRT